MRKILKIILSIFFLISILHSGSVLAAPSNKVSLSASPVTVTSGGNSVLKWTVFPFTNLYTGSMTKDQYMESITCRGSNGLNGVSKIYGGIPNTYQVSNLTSTKTYTITCEDTYGNSGEGSVTVTVVPAGMKKNLSRLFVSTGEANNITYTSATLHGNGGDSIGTPTLPITGYFRYSPAVISPIFCNDIYGTNMVSTKDIFLGTTSGSDFDQNISNLIPDTTYYYCAIISNKENIAYGGANIVRQFHTSPYNTTIKTSSASSITSSGAQLNGSYSSIEDVTTYFQFKKATSDSASLPWVETEKIVHKLGGESNIFGTIKTDKKYFQNEPLSPSTKYQFRAVAVTNSHGETKTKYGAILYFTTSPIGSSDDDGTRTGSTVTCRYPYIFDSETNACVDGKENTLTCRTPYIFDADANSCIYDSKLPSVKVTANPDTINSGESSTISWTSNGVSICETDGHRAATSGSFSTGPLAKGKAYAITCSGTYGKAGAYAYVSVRSTVPPGLGNGTGNRPSVTVTANPSIVNSGESSTISWTSNGVLICETDGHRAATSGSFSTGPLLSRKSYAITCSGENGSASGYTYVSLNNQRTGTSSGTRTGSGSGSGSGSGWGNGSGSGSGSGSGWGNGSGSGSGSGSGIIGIINTPPMTLGQTATPPSDAIVRYHEGIETVFVRQIMNDVAFAKIYGYEEGTDLQGFAWNLADQLARSFGYVSEDGREIRVSLPDVAAYQLQMIGDKITVYEYYESKIVDIRNVTSVFKNASGYEYYFKK